MGFRLAGLALEHKGDVEMLSDTTLFGALQAPPSGQPILLMADRPTTGGYPIIATVISADIGLAGQLAPGDLVSFVVCSRHDAIAALIAQEQAFMSLEGAQPVNLR
jgi:antagonist of KipI